MAIVRVGFVRSRSTRMAIVMMCCQGEQEIASTPADRVIFVQIYAVMHEATIVCYGTEGRNTEVPNRCKHSANSTAIGLHPGPSQQ